MTTGVRPGQESARDLVKLLISLASGVIAISATFANKSSADARIPLLLLGLAWVALAISIYFGVHCLSAIVDVQSKDTANWGESVLPPMRKCWVLFQVGVALLLAYGLVAAFFEPKTHETPVSVVPLASEPGNTASGSANPNGSGFGGAGSNAGHGSQPRTH